MDILNYEVEGHCERFEGIDYTYITVKFDEDIFNIECELENPEHDYNEKVFYQAINVEMADYCKMINFLEQKGFDEDSDFVQNLIEDIENCADDLVGENNEHLLRTNNDLLKRFIEQLLFEEEEDEGYYSDLESISFFCRSWRVKEETRNETEENIDGEVTVKNLLNGNILKFRFIESKEFEEILFAEEV